MSCNNNNILQVNKNLGIRHNVSFRVIDKSTGRIVQQVEGHNSATNSMLVGIAHYLTGDGVFNQGIHMLSNYVPRYISLGTMGLVNQEEDVNGLPLGIGVVDGDDEEKRFTDYMNQCPGFGADGYDDNENNNRMYSGLGPVYQNRASSKTINCELISGTFPRADISYRDIVPETKAELPKTIDVVFSAMISTGALAQFRDYKSDSIVTSGEPSNPSQSNCYCDCNCNCNPNMNGSSDTVNESERNRYLFITEAGLWSKRDWTSGGNNGLLAGYRIVPPNEENWDMSKQENRDILKRCILRVGINQVVQVIWKIQLGAIEQLYPNI